MIEEPVVMQCDVCTSSIEVGIRALTKHKPNGGRVFFVVFTPAHRVFTRPMEDTLTHGYDAVKFIPKDDLPSDNAWDLVMYSTATGEAIVKWSHRPEY